MTEDHETRLRLQRARLALQTSEDQQGVRSYERRSLGRVKHGGVVYEVGGHISGLLLALRTIVVEESWAALVEVKDLGWEAAAARGLDLQRMVGITCGPGQGAPVLSTLLEGFEIVVVGQVELTLPQQRTLAARTRLLERTILTVTSWPLVSSRFPFAVDSLPMWQRGVG